MSDRTSAKSAFSGAKSSAPQEKNAAASSGVRGSASVFRLTPPILGILLAVCYTAAMSRDFDFSIGHFEPASFFFGAAVFLGAAGAVLSVLSWILYTGRHALTSLPAPTPLSLAGAVLGALLSAALCMQTLLNYQTARAAETAETLSPSKLFLFSALFGLFLAIALLLALSRERRHRWYALICTLFGALSVNIAMFGAYFDFALPLNSPVRNFTTLCQASVLLFLLSEARIALTPEDKPDDLPAGFQLFASSACAVFGIGIGGGGALWQLIRSFSFGSEIIGKTPEPNLPVLRLALYLAVGLIAADRLLRLSLRRLTPEEIAARRQAAREEKENKKSAPSSGDKEQNQSSEA